MKYFFEKSKLFSKLRGGVENFSKTFSEILDFVQKIHMLLRHGIFWGFFEKYFIFFKMNSGNFSEDFLKDFLALSTEYTDRGIPEDRGPHGTMFGDRGPRLCR